MRRFLTACVPLLYVCAGVCAHATELSQADAPTSMTIVSPPPGGVQSVTSAQLQSDEIAALLEHLQSQHVYLKHLENMRRALEKELSIVRLVGECDRAGGVCTGRGVSEKAMPDAPPVPEAPPAPPEPPTPPPELSEPPSAESPGAAHVLPGVAGIYRDAALLVDRGRYREVRVGARIGAFTVTAITLDRVELDGPGGSVVLSAQRYSPPLQPPPGVFYESDEF